MTEGRKYTIIEVIGHGGFGTVYRARLTGPEGFSKDVALKVLRKDMADIDEVAQRFRDEARLLGLIRHHAIVRVDALTRMQGRWTVIMEFVDGVALDQVIAHKPVPVGPALEIIETVANTLDVAYNQPGPDQRPLHLIHRDIKPSNLKITLAGAVRVLDFGVARADFALREASTRSLAYGSLPYMSPERQDFIDTAGGDVYALGAVLFELLSGERFGKTSGHPGRHRALLGRRLAQIREDGGPHSAEVASLIAHMMAYEPDDRYTAREVERQCRRLTRRIDDESLRDWTERELPRIPSLPPKPTPDALSGSTLFEAISDDAPDAIISDEPISDEPLSARPSPAQPTGPAVSPASSSPTPPSPRLSPRTAFLIAALLTVFLALLVSGGLGLGALFVRDQAPPPPTRPALPQSVEVLVEPAPVASQPSEIQPSEIQPSEIQPSEKQPSTATPERTPRPHSASSADHEPPDASTSQSSTSARSTPGAASDAPTTHQPSAPSSEQPWGDTTTAMEPPSQVTSTTPGAPPLGTTEPSVLVVGNFSLIYLRSAHRTYVLSKTDQITQVLPGDYAISAVFRTTTKPIPFGSVTVAPGQRVVINCDAWYEVCGVQD